MADTITTNYHWVKPDISGSPTTWGVKINADLDLIDDKLFTTTTNATVIGQITMFAGDTAPDNWLLCDGTVYPNSYFPLLAPILNNIYGGVSGVSNAVPDMRGRFPIGTGDVGGGVGFGAGDTGGEAGHTLVDEEMPAHAHYVAVSITVDDPAHNHGVDDPGHSHTYNMPDPGQQAVDGAIRDAGWFNTDTFPSTTGIGIQWNVTGINVSASADTEVVGGSGSHNNMPPWIGVNFIIRYQ